jgi:hypothetical protein
MSCGRSTSHALSETLDAAKAGHVDTAAPLTQLQFACPGQTSCIDRCTTVPAHCSTQELPTHAHRNSDAHLHHDRVCQVLVVSLALNARWPGTVLHCRPSCARASLQKRKVSRGHGFGPGSIPNGLRDLIVSRDIPGLDGYRDGLPWRHVPRAPGCRRPVVPQDASCASATGKMHCTDLALDSPRR